jgi:hypothetical protein
LLVINVDGKILSPVATSIAACCNACCWQGCKKRGNLEEKNGGRKPQRDSIEGGPSQDGVDRRGFLKCMAWAGTGLVWTLSGGIPTSRPFGATGREGHRDAGFSFVQISDSHIGFNKGANPDVTATLQAAIDKINSLPAVPDLIMHTGDLSQISKPGEFDTVDQVLRGAKAKQVFYVPGKHDFATDNGQQFLERYGKGTKGAGWQSFDHKGVHFIGLNNVANLKAGGMGSLGADQLEWLEDDVKGLSASTPIVLFSHIPLWAVYPEWGWGTQDSAQALTYLKRFGSVTVLNGHIHQIMQKVEGNVSFHTAMAIGSGLPSSVSKIRDACHFAKRPECGPAKETPRR